MVILIGGIFGSFVVMVAADNFGGVADSPLAIAAFVGALLATMFLTFAAAVYFFPKRHVTFRKDSNQGERVLQVIQDSKLQLIKATFTVLDSEGVTIAKFSKNIFTNILR